MKKPREFGACPLSTEPLQVLTRRDRLTGLIRPVSQILWGNTCKELFGRGRPLPLRSALSRDEEVPSALLFSSDLPSFFCLLLGILKNMSSLVSIDVKRGGGISFAEGADGVGGWVRRAGALRCSGGAADGRICLRLVSRTQFSISISHLLCSSA